MSPRGYSGAILGNSAFMGTTEFRSPLINLNIIEVLRIIKAGKLSLSIISDYGKVWGSNNDEWIITAGIEARASLLIGNLPLLVYSLGIAQTIDGWSDNPNAKGVDPYIRLALVNPF